MRVINGLIGALIGSLFGAAIWTTVSYFTHNPLGFMAWLVGVATGLGFFIGSRGRGGAGMGVLAAVLAISGIFTGKLLVANILVSTHMEKQLESIGEAEALAELKNDVLDQFLREQRVMTWPRDRTPEDALDAGYMPPEAIKEAEARWRRMSDETRQEYVAGVKIQAHDQLDDITLVGTIVQFIASFRLFDLLWCVIAVGSAYSIASRKQTEAEKATAVPAAKPAEAVTLRNNAHPRAKPVEAPVAAAAKAEEPAGNSSFFRGVPIAEDFPDPAAKFIKKPSGGENANRDAA